MIDIKDIAPMKALRRIKVLFPHVFEMIDMVVESREKEVRDKWDHGVVYGPVALTRAAKEEVSGEEDIVQQAPLELALITALAGWRKAKTLYDFAPELSEEIIKAAQRTDLTMPVDALSLPYWCIYIRPNVPEWDIDGFFVYYDEFIDKETGRHFQEIRFTALDKSGRPGPTPYLIINPEDDEISIQDCLGNNHKTLDEIDLRENLAMAGQTMRFPVDELHATIDKLEERTAQLLSFVLYLSAVNADVKKDAKHVFRRTKKVRDIPREVEYLHVGEEAAVRIRDLRQSAAKQGESLGGHHRSPAAHIRRAHWHTFRIGEGRKKTRVKWLAPMLINPSAPADNVVKISLVKKK